VLSWYFSDPGDCEASDFGGSRFLHVSASVCLPDASSRRIKRLMASQRVEWSRSPSGEGLRDITFLNAAEGVRINLHQLLTQDHWPSPLLDNLYTTERDAYQSAMEEVIAESRQGALTQGTLQRVDEAVNRLRAKLDRDPPLDFISAQEAREHVAALAATAQMLRRRHVAEMVADVRTTRLRTLGELLDFMFKYNVRFGPAGTPGERQAYLDFYPILAEARDQVLPQPRGDQQQVGDEVAGK
jgi:hypothetical protein